MAIIIDSGITLGSELVFDASLVNHGSYTQYYFTIQNWAWRVTSTYPEVFGFTSSYDYSKEVPRFYGQNKVAFTRNDHWYIVYEMLDRPVTPIKFFQRDKTFVYTNYPYAAANYPAGSQLTLSKVPGQKSKCLIDVDVKIYADNYRQYTVYNRSGVFHQQDNYYSTIIENVINDFYS